jgi:hypothetical protein
MRVIYTYRREKHCDAPIVLDTCLVQFLLPHIWDTTDISMLMFVCLRFGLWIFSMYSNTFCLEASWVGYMRWRMVLVIRSRESLSELGM